MKTRTVLQAIARTVADEAESNPEFDAKLRLALQIDGRGADLVSIGRGRRSPASFDPVQAARGGEVDLRSKLEALDIEQLKDIVAQYSMDPKKLAMKWKTRERVVNLIVEMSMQRATKGDAFRKSSLGVTNDRGDQPLVGVHHPDKDGTQ